MSSQYYKITRRLGTPHRNSVTVTIPLVGPQGPAGPQGPQGLPGEVSGSIAWDNVSDKPTTFPPSSHTHVAADVTDFTAAVEAVSPPADWNTLANKPSTFPPSTHTHVAVDVTDFSTAAAAAAPVQSVAGRTGTVTLAVADVANAVADTDARLTDSRTPTSHASSHAAAGSDPVFDQDLNTDDSVAFANIQVTEGLLNAYGLGFEGDLKIELETNTLIGNFEILGALNFTGTDAATNAATTRTNLGLGDSATADIGTTEGTVAAGDDSRFSDIPDPSSATPQALGSASAGTSDDYSRGDHIHAAPALNDLSNVSAATPSDNDVLVFDTATSTWVAEAPAASGIAETLLDAKGDLIVASAADTAARLAVGGTDGHVLTVDSNETLGVKWAAASAGVGGGTGSTDNAILRADGTGGSTLQDSALVIDDATTSTQANVAIRNNHSETNSALVLSPKGTGALIAQKPDGTTTGGNARGTRVVDWQLDRLNANEVASGSDSVIGGGRRNRVSGLESVVSGGRSNQATNDNSFVGGGAANSATGAYGTIVGGQECLASGSRSFVGAGQQNHSTNSFCVVASGFDNQATGNSSAILGGRRGLADRYSIQAHAADQFAARGDAQRIRAVLRCKTTTDSAVEMALDGSTTYLTIPSGKVIFCNIKVVGVKSDGATVATYERQYAAKNVAGTSTEIYAPVTIGTDNAASTTLAVSVVDQAGAATDYISIQPTGIASETWRWVASVDAVEVAYGT
jgi:hypothetical protein